jgi:hypothetical protein
MRSNFGSENLDGDWNRVSGVTPCPVCGGRVDCRTHADEDFVCCLREPSDWRLSNGGWLHRLQPSGGVSASLLTVQDPPLSRAKASSAGASS